MRLLGVLASAALVLGDTCYKGAGGYAVSLVQKGTKLHVTARANGDWVGFGVPKSNDFDEMPRGNFMLGGGGAVHDQLLPMDYNSRPTVAGHAGYVSGTQTVKTENGMTTMSFERELAPSGYNPIDPSKPFRLLWAFGAVTGGTGFDSFQYHGRNRGSFIVDLSKSGDCDSATASALALPAAPTPAPGKGKKGKKAKAAKTPAVCPTGQIRCTAASVAQGSNCIVGLCSPAPAVPAPAVPVCDVGQTICTAAYQAQGANCIVGRCFPMPAPKVPDCLVGQIMCTAASQAQGANCIVGRCFSMAVKVPDCTTGTTMCTAALQAQGANCIVGRCFPMITQPVNVPDCTAGQTMCTAALQAQGANCIVGKCFQMATRPVTVPDCIVGQTICTAALQAQGANCIVGRCFTNTQAMSAPEPVMMSKQCPPRQMECTASMQASGNNCELGACVNDPNAKSGPCPPGQTPCTPVLQTSLNCDPAECVEIRLTPDFARKAPKAPPGRR